MGPCTAGDCTAEDGSQVAMTEVAPEFVFASEREAAAKLRAAASAAGMKLHALPYSRFDPDRSTWWLAPDPANPAYAFGKVVVERPTIVDDGAKLIGLHVEKGVGAKAASFFEETSRGRRLIMGRDWTWHPFHRALRSGALDEAIVHAESAADGLPLVVEVVAAVAYPRRAMATRTGRWIRMPSSAFGIGSRVAIFSVGREEDGVPSSRLWRSRNDGIAGRKDRGDRRPRLDLGGSSDRRALSARPERWTRPTEVWQRVCAPWKSWLR